MKKLINNGVALSHDRKVDIIEGIAYSSKSGTILNKDIFESLIVDISDKVLDTTDPDKVALYANILNKLSSNKQEKESSVRSNLRKHCFETLVA